MAYATTADVQARMMRTMSQDEQTVCATLLEDAAVMIDAAAPEASGSAKMVVSCRMVIRAIGDGADSGVPYGATQGSQSALGYSQSWTIGASGGAGEIYLSRADKKLLGANGVIGSYSPTEELVPEVEL